MSAAAAAAANVYGGDEISAVVLDAGLYHTRIGFAGDDFPKVITPSYYAAPIDGADVDLKPTWLEKRPLGRIFGESINVPRLNYEIRPIMAESAIIDWDAALDQYTKYFNDEMRLDFKEQPILITEPVWTLTAYRKKLVETFYELFDFAALFLAKPPTCILFQQGRPNCLVVDIGHDTVSCTPVVDGILLLKNSMRTHYTGRFLTDQWRDLLQARQIDVVPLYRVRSKVPTHFPDAASFELRTTLGAPDADRYSLPANITQSYDEYQKERVYNEMKETLLEVPEKKLVPPQPNAKDPREAYSDELYKRGFEFPNGQTVEFGVERFEVADALFEPQGHRFKSAELQQRYPDETGTLKIDTTAEEYKPLKRARKAESATLTPPPQEAKNTPRGLSQLITQTLSSVDIDLRASVAHNIIITGSTSLIPQLTERLYAELLNLNPGLKIRLHATGNTTERFNQTWIGGSVLASLGTFHQMWVSKQEYEEAGSDRILSQRFR
jgi:actin-related protein 4